MEIIVGTAGHIDHGKTSLVRALTGTDADRLPEEKQRGITIDLGFAEMSAEGVHFGFVDVPGHERFVKNMLAGASGIDLVMLVIAADEGVMPQTREHFDICRLLGVKAGIIALTKSDMVDAETLELARIDAAELVAGSFLETAPVVCVSARTGDGIDELKAALTLAGKQNFKKNDRLVSRLPIDRSFSMKGFGAVVTGTLVSGEISEGGELELFPAKRRVRVRGLQTHGRAAKTAKAGQRTAVNLGGIDYSDITRGMMLVEPDTLRLTQVIDAEIEVLSDAARPLRTRQRVHLHIGTAEVLARIQILAAENEIACGKSGFVQLRLETPIVAAAGERFILRSYSPLATIAGGVIVDAFPPKHRKKEFDVVCEHLTSLVNADGNENETIRLLIARAGNRGLSFSDIQAQTALCSEFLKPAIQANIDAGSMIDAGGIYVSRSAFVELSELTLAEISKFHKQEPLSTGISREALRERVFAFLPDEIFRGVLSASIADGEIIADKDTLKLASHKTELSPAETALGDKIRKMYTDAGLNVPKFDEALAVAGENSGLTPPQVRKFFQMFLDSGEIVKVSEEFYFSRQVLDNLTDGVRAFAAASADRLIDMAAFKDIAGVSRKYAIPLIEYLDRQKVTQRVGEKRIVLK